jgi:tRNA pseudouridine65 synthase
VPIAIIYQGDDWCAVDKPSGILVHDSAYAGPPERTVTDEVRAAGFPSAAPVHRLDRQTSGVLVFALNGDAARIWQSHLTTTRKHYLAVVRGRVMAAIDVDHPLDNPDKPGSARHPARSCIIPIAVSNRERLSLVEVVLLEGGRMHQVRRHCKHASHPILGDANYGKGPINRDMRDRYGLNRLALHAWWLSSPLGTIISAPAPMWPWQMFDDMPVIDLAASLAAQTHRITNEQERHQRQQQDHAAGVGQQLDLGVDVAAGDPLDAEHKNL